MVRRSRELWDEARRPNSPKTALLRAILYELQPVRVSLVDLTAVRSIVRSTTRGLVSFTTQTLPSASGGSYRLVRSMSLRRWSWAAAVIAYFYGVRYIHSVLDAGPIVLIISALVALFTIGLDDNARDDGVSAYSVFNRGFQRLLGSVDVESLVAQHVGGAMGVAGVGLAAPQQQQNENDDLRGELGVARLPQEARGQNEENEQNDNAAPPPPRSRKSGKKARRGNLEQRREQQRQRQAAMAMGFAGDGGPEEMMAMQRLIEEQIAANNNAGHDHDDD